MKARKIKENIYWVGAVDWDVRNFHGYLTQRGTTYNAYLIIDEKITLVDSVKPGLTQEMMKRISSIIDPSKIDYIVCNHVEMDHSGAIPAVMALAPKAKIITCPQGVKGLETHYKGNWDYIEVTTGDSFSIGKRTFEFILTPMVHWPDNMVCYIPEEKILFSNDSLGQHYATHERFDDETSLDIALEEAKKYFANIVLSYSKEVKKELEAIAPLDIEMVATSHGIIWRKHIKEIVSSYTKWANNITNKKAIIVYDTMWGSTQKMAGAIQEAFEDKGYHVVMLNLQHNHISDIMTELIDAEYICVGSPTLNKNLMPSVAAFLTYLRGLSPGKRKAIAFSSYGWGGQAITQVSKYLKECQFDVLEEIKFKYIPGEDDLSEITTTVKNLIH